ncbi:MAG: sugar-binding transcriptional regulator [Bauldia sp.]|nr:sugar-binding transcriptional regulator [Bauldia sp.]
MVAKLHYEADMAQVEIARKLNVSTSTVSRLLHKARALGIVRIEVLDPVVPEEITERLAEALGLKAAAVIDTPSTGILAALTTPLRDLLRQADLKPSSVIGIGWGRAVREVIQAGLPRMPDVHVVALNGGHQESAPHLQINEFVRNAAEQTGGKAHFMHAPYFSSASLRDAFLGDPGIREKVDLWDRIDCTIVGVGLHHRDADPESHSLLRDDSLSADAVGDVIRHYFDVQGNVVPWDGEGRMIAASVDQLRNARLSIGVAVSVEKAPSIIGAVRSRMINALVTDTSTALAILERTGSH